MSHFIGQRKYWTSFPKIRGRGGKEGVKKRKESGREDSGWTSKLGTGCIREKASNNWNRTIIKDTAKKKLFELNEGLSWWTRKTTVGCRKNQ